MSLTKAELVNLLAAKVCHNRFDARVLVDMFFDEIQIALERGNSVKLPGFGNFQLIEKPQRPGRNPKTYEEIPITARRVVTFHPCQSLKESVVKARTSAASTPKSKTVLQSVERDSTSR